MLAGALCAALVPSAIRIFQLVLKLEVQDRFLQDQRLVCHHPALLE
jgi:hypothetical protein